LIPYPKGYFEYSQSLWEHATILKMADEFIKLLQEMSQNPSAQIRTWLCTSSDHPISEHIPLAKISGSPKDSTSLSLQPNASMQHWQGILLEEWQKILQRSDISIHQNFFDLGGNSLLLAQLHYRLQQKISADLQLLDLFQYPSIALLSQFLNARAGTYDSTASLIQESEQQAQLRLKRLQERKKRN